MRALSALRSKDRCDGDDGAALVMVVLVLFTLLAFAAIAVDTAALVQERRTLQNGADAGALAVAQQCASETGCTDWTADGIADELSDDNADDGEAEVELVCGTGPLDACTTPPTGVTSGADYAKVTVRTETDSGSSKVPFNFAGIFGQDGQTVRRTAAVMWGSPKSYTSELPLTIARCEWRDHTDNGDRYGNPQTGAGETTLRYHRDYDDFWGDCGRRRGWPERGGFGWLDPNDRSGCLTPSEADEWVDSANGRALPGGCSGSTLASLVGTVVVVPVFDQYWDWDWWEDDDDDASFHVVGYAAFYLTGYSLAGGLRQRSIVDGDYPCDADETCISGIFVKHQISTGGTIGGPSMGATVLQFVQ